MKRILLLFFAFLLPQLAGLHAAELATNLSNIAKDDVPAGSGLAKKSLFLAGAVAVDVTPTSETSIVAGGFLEAQASKITDRLFARSIVLDDGITKIALTVVDSCMMSQTLIDDAKRLASNQTGIPVDKMMVSATHTHSAPAAMACLGTRQDKAYALGLPSKIAEAIVKANSQLEPARIGWNSTDDWEDTHNRRWIRKPESKVIDPFGSATGLAHMHPGYQSKDIIGPSGPVDPELFVLSLQKLDGKPLAVLANYSQHYFGSQAISSDYYGLFCKFVAEKLNEPGEGNGPFVCAISQGTSGDLMWMDYGSPQETITLANYAESVARYAEQALDTIEYRDFATLAMVEKTVPLRYRVPNEERLTWARPIAEGIEQELPKNLAEVYAMEAVILHERQTTELKLQAIRIGELTIATLPNEVYALTGLKLKGRSPSDSHFNIELANGAEGYIPPPEQHTLGGYTTWPARTAGLEEQAEPKIVDTLVEALEEATGKKRRSMDDEHGPYAASVMLATPIGYWRLNDADGASARNAIQGTAPARFSPGFAWYLPGVGSGTGIGLQEELKASSFSGADQINRAVHLAGGEMTVDWAHSGQSFSAAFWFWLGERFGASDRSGLLINGPSGETLAAKQFADHTFQLELLGRASLPLWSADEWHFVSIVRERDMVKIYMDGASEPVLQTKVIAGSALAKEVTFGRGLQGKLDEVALFDRGLTVEEFASFWKASGIPEQRQRDTVASPSPGTRSIKPASQPLSASKALAKIHVPVGFRVELVACEPQVIDPVAFDWDESGRLWVAEMSDYPLGMDGQGKPGGRVRILEDRDRDGKYEHSTLFADELNFPNGILTWRDGVLVTAAPHILFLRDTNGDGQVDTKEVLFEGFNEGNQQLRMNGLRWGLDNWVYCANGGHHANHGLGTKVLSHRMGLSYEIGSRDFLFQPDTGALRLESGPSQFGRNRDAWGHWFGTQNAKPLWNYVFPDRYLARNPYVPSLNPIQFVLPPNSPQVFPASRPEKRFHSYQEAGHFTSACGGMIYGDQRLFGPSEKLHAFTCEPFHNLVQHNVIHDVGVSFTSQRPTDEGRFDFFASEDRWCRPVMVRTGPDGALWIADMYRYMIEHPQWLPPEGQKELLPHYRLGDDRGRIYRVVPEGEETVSVWKLGADKLDSLLAALDSPNDWQRDKAQQLLVWRRDLSAIPSLQELVRSSSRPETRLQALATLDGLDALKAPMVIVGLADPHPRVRENAIKLAERVSEEAVIKAALQLVSDPDPKVCLQLALTLGEWPDAAAGAALVELAKRHYDESFMRSAIMSSALRHAEVFAVGIAQSSAAVLSAFREPIARQSVGRKDLRVIGLLLADALASTDQALVTKLDELLLTLQRIGTSLEELRSADTQNVLASHVEQIDAAMVSMLGLAGDDRRDPKDRIAAAKLLCRSSLHRDTGISLLAKWLSPQYAPELQQQVLETYLQCGQDKVLESLANAWPEFTPDLRSRALEVWTSRAAWTNDMLRRVEDGKISAHSLDLALRDRLMRYPDADVAERSKRLFQEAGRSTRKQIVDDFRPAFALKGDPVMGRTVFLRACASCHRREDQGSDVGPNLATVVGHSDDKLLINILDPNADIQPGYQAYSILLKSDEVLSGLLAGETSNSVEMKQTNGITRTISRLDIEKIRNSNVSFMPEGLEAVLSQQEMANLLVFLRQPILAQP